MYVYIPTTLQKNNMMIPSTLQGTNISHLGNHLQKCLFGGDMGVSKNSGTPKSSILIGFAIINHPFWGTIIFGNIHMLVPRRVTNYVRFLQRSFCHQKLQLKHPRCVSQQRIHGHHIQLQSLSDTNRFTQGGGMVMENMLLMVHVG